MTFRDCRPGETPDERPLKTVVLRRVPTKDLGRGVLPQADPIPSPDLHRTEIRMIKGARVSDKVHAVCLYGS